MKLRTFMAMAFGVALGYVVTISRKIDSARTDDDLASGDSISGDNMHPIHFVPSNLHEGGFGPPSYQPAPLAEYLPQFREQAEALYHRVQASLPERQCKKHKGSYSIFSRFGSFTAAKIVIYEAGLGKRNGKWPPLPDGVYVLLRVPANDPNESIGIAPKREGRFSYFPVNEENLEEAVESIVKAA